MWKLLMVSCPAPHVLIVVFVLDLGKLLKGKDVHINLIPYNSTDVGVQYEVLLIISHLFLLLFRNSRVLLKRMSNLLSWF